ncbi:MAG: MgtC/SapB family protein [Bacteroidota bacterium]|uniref:Mg(2+) transport ATPase protein C n=1 Tax=Christiangramia flava JLT2011 TaxID=1229726 RepID=A0A1L7I4A3_9FLAO|nr:MgtC/SapB family protein [Christiangramia flava]APU68448.1 Mg(2+) transport ATPase protein C [Christiangramia flava JLT2011]MAM19828.1 magnesium transporter MgtC [Christiangramia sp.]MEE2771150.1 MgtC/SapB family protein [Bacteroidota bacterium]OSS40764.1 Mg(2+) transport ATPase protein C [Christiangramia flava JLT2011]|tara:strand:- start:544 stop:987 length:444 start_codon:yes stop_codon:yes gene_type:complete
MDLKEFTIKAVIAVIAGLLIGLEREFRGKHAGLKTHALVALGASVFICLSLEYEGDKYVDITRVLSQVIIGIGFIGAGTIMKKGKDVEGLTTAATIWCSAGIGCLSGFGMFLEVVVVTLLIVVVNYFFGKIEKKILKHLDSKKNSTD